MKFKLDTQIPVFENKISYEKKLVFIGSCFSDEISSKFKFAGFNVLSNPFGTIFHPLALARNIEKTILKSDSFPIFEANKNFYSWDCSSLLHAKSIFELKEKLAKSQLELFDYLKNASHFFITLGSSFSYLLKENKYLVANCHKQTNSLFEKNLTEISEMEVVWKRVINLIYELNPCIQIVFTLSPVRHAKDGLIENNRSKARLFELISVLEKQFPVFYFPSYEIVLDELRDYRFYKEDLLHPNQQAIDFIWEKIKLVFLDEAKSKIAEEVEKLRKLDSHLIQTEHEEDRNAFEEMKKLKIQKFLKENTQIKW